MSKEPNPGYRESKAPLNAAAVRAKLRALRNGEVPLGQTFWLYYFAAVAALRFLGALPGPAGTVFNLLALFWAMWMVRPVVKSAKNYRGAKNRPLFAKIGALLLVFFVLTGFLF